MRTVKKSFLLFIILSLTSCSFMVNDFKRMTKGTKYVVEHYQEVVAEYDVNSESQNNEITYSLVESQILYGEDGDKTKAVAKNYAGFTAQSFEQETINPDGSAVVKIYYDRNLVTITVSIGEGIWNYKAKKEDPTLDDEKDNKTFTRKYGSLLDIDLSQAGKKGCTLTKWIVEDLSGIKTETIILPQTFPSTDVTYTAVWEEGKPANYTIVHHFEKVDCADISIETNENYEIKSELTLVKKGVPEMETETQDCVASVQGFTAKPHSEKEIASTSTVVDIYYVRNPYSITISTDEGLWNYDEWKADKANVSQEISPKIYNGKFGADIDWSFLSSLKKTGMNLVSLKNDITGEVVKLDKLPSTIPAMSLAYTAQWSKKAPVGYEVKFMTEIVDSTDSDDVNNYFLNSYDRTLSGTPEYYTEAIAKEIPGFTAKEINQEEIKEDGTTEVFVYYTRNAYKITFDLNGGYWNYIDYRNDKSSITPDSDSREILGKYEADVVLPDFSKMGKRANDFNCWKNLSDGKTYTTEELNQAVQKIPSSNVVIQAQWTKGTGYEYTVEHWFEKIDSKDSSNTSNYENREDLTQTELGEEIGDDTEAVAKVIEGFTSKPFTQEKIAEDGSTKVIIYYTRNSSKFIFDANDGVISEGQSQITGKYGITFDADSTPKATKSGWTFGGWKYNGKLVTNADLQIENFIFETEDKVFQAYWVSMISVKTLTTFGDINLVKVQDSHNVTCSIELPSGYDSQSWNYKWYVDGVYTSDETVFSRTLEVLGRGVHTITVKATMNGQNFTQRVTAIVE